MIAVRLLEGGVIVREALFKDASVRIGRGEENEFVVLHPSISRCHARVFADEDGTVRIEDLASRNGLHEGDTRVEKVVLSPGRATRLRLGAVELELALASADETQEWAIPVEASAAGWRSWRAAAFWAAGVAAGAILMVIEPSFWSPWQPDRVASFSWTCLLLAVSLPVLAFVLVGVMRVAGRRPGVGDALRALAIVVAGWVVTSLLESVSYYALPTSAHALVSTLLMGGGLVATLSYLASLARPGRKARFVATWATALAVLGAGFGAAANLAARQAGAPRVDQDARVPIGGHTGPATGLDPYLEAVLDSFEAAQQAAEKDRRQQEAGGG